MFKSHSPRSKAILGITQIITTKPVNYAVHPMLKCQHTKFNQNILFCTVSMSYLFTQAKRSRNLLARCSTLFFL